MNSRLPLAVLVFTVVTTLLCWALEPVIDLDALWRRGEFAAARETIGANLAAGNSDPVFLAQAAICSEAMRDYQAAADLYAASAKSLTWDLNAYRETKEHEYLCRWLASGEDADAGWIDEVLDEIRALEMHAGSGVNAQRQLAFELEYILAELTGADTEADEALARSYPGSQVALRLAKAAADEIAIERDDRKQIALIERFLEKFPDSYWRHIAYRYWLNGVWRLGRKDQLRQIAGDYLKEYPNHPESLGAVSRYYFETDIEPELGRRYAERSVEMFETMIGLDGSIASLERVHKATRSIPPQPDYLPPSERTQFLTYLASRYNLARYQVAAGEYEAAVSLLQPVIDIQPYTTEDELTLAPFYLTMGRAAELSEDYVSAYAYYLGALIDGDTRNRFALQASQSLADVEAKISREEADAAIGAYIPAKLSGLAFPVFRDITAEAGLEGLAHRRVAWGDIDGDGDADLLLDGKKLYINDDGMFRDATREWGLKGDMSGGLFADYDNDGDLDLYTITEGRSGDRLWRNENPGLVDVTALAGNPTDDYPGEGAAWLDYDNDGWIDLYVANYEKPAKETSGERGVGTPDRLYHNEGARLVLVEPGQSGMLPPFGEQQAGRGVCAADYDGDGWQDIFVGNYRLQENLLWKFDGTAFANHARKLGVAGYSVDNWWGHTIGSDWGDIDNDGDLDLFCANLAHPRYAHFSDKSMMLVSSPGTAGPEFEDQRGRRGIKYEETHADPLFFDCNNDGYLDLYITSTYANRRSFLYLNDGTGNFVDVTYLSGARIFDGWGCACADYDLDGDLDLAVGSPSGLRLLENTTPRRNWLQVACVGGATRSTATTLFTPALLRDQPDERRLSAIEEIIDDLGGAEESEPLPYSNAAGIGSRLTLAAGETVQLREIQSGRGTTSGNELIAHFGLGGYQGPVTLSVRFPSGRVVEMELASVNQRIIVNERETASVEPPVEPAGVEPDTAEEEVDEDRPNKGLLERTGDSRGG